MVESNQNESNGFKIPEGKWAIYLFVTITILFIIAYKMFTRHKHISKGKYVGPKTCTSCHEKQAKSWSTTRMANSFDVLRPGKKVDEKHLAGLDPQKDYTKDEDCLLCHTTGYGLTGGFVSIEETPGMAGVTCEACHGPGGAYSDNPMAKEPTFSLSEVRDAGLVYPPTARVCRKCHNEDSPFIDMKYRFDYKKRVEKGTHEHYQLKYNHK